MAGVSCFSDTFATWPFWHDACHYRAGFSPGKRTAEQSAQTKNKLSEANKLRSGNFWQISVWSHWRSRGSMCLESWFAKFRQLTSSPPKICGEEQEEIKKYANLVRKKKLANGILSLRLSMQQKEKKGLHPFDVDKSVLRHKANYTHIVAMQQR